MTFLRGDANAYSQYSPLVPVLRTLELASTRRSSRDDCRDLFRRIGAGRSVGRNRSTSVGGLRAADLPRRRIYLDAWLLVLQRRWMLFLGSRNMGVSARSRLPDDVNLLELSERTLCLKCRILWSKRQLLRRNRRRVQLHRQRLRIHLLEARVA